MNPILVDIVFDPNNVNYFLLSFFGVGFNYLNFDENGKDTFLTFLENDNFSTETLQNKENKPLLNILKSVKSEAKLFHGLTLSQSQFLIEKELKGPELNGKTILNMYKNFELHISRLRIMIQPEFTVTRFVHPVSKITYIGVRGYWYTNYEEKKRILSKNIGKEEDFENGREDVNAVELARKTIQDMCKIEYSKIYKK